MRRPPPHPADAVGAGDDLTNQAFSITRPACPMLERPQQSTQYQRRTQAVRPTGLTPAMSPEAAQRIAPNTSPSPIQPPLSARPAALSQSHRRDTIGPDPIHAPAGSTPRHEHVGLHRRPARWRSDQCERLQGQHVEPATGCRRRPQRAAAAPATQPVKPPQQTEAANPMVGTQATAPTGATTAVTPRHPRPPPASAAAGRRSAGPGCASRRSEHGRQRRLRPTLPVLPRPRFTTPTFWSLFGDAQAGAQ